MEHGRLNFFRIYPLSNHKLEIEQGRYKMELKMKYISYLEKIRKTILPMIYKFYLNSEKLSDTDKFIWIMTTEDPDMLHL